MSTLFNLECSCDELTCSGALEVKELPCSAPLLCLQSLFGWLVPVDKGRQSQPILKYLTGLLVPLDQVHRKAILLSIAMIVS